MSIVNVSETSAAIAMYEEIITYVQNCQSALKPKKSVAFFFLYV